MSTERQAKVLATIAESGEPTKVSLYDEEGIEGWEWTHQDGQS